MTTILTLGAQSWRVSGWVAPILAGEFVLPDGARITEVCCILDDGQEKRSRAGELRLVRAADLSVSVEVTAPEIKWAHDLVVDGERHVVGDLRVWDMWQDHLNTGAP